MVSCSSIYSGYFNAYGRIAERTDVDALVHLGDYLYDFVDDEERVRVPMPEPLVPDDVVGWRGRHAYYLTDPNLRAARASMGPLVVSTWTSPRRCVTRMLPLVASQRA